MTGPNKKSKSLARDFDRGISQRQVRGFDHSEREGDFVNFNVCLLKLT